MGRPPKVKPGEQSRASSPAGSLFSEVSDSEKTIAATPQYPTGLKKYVDKAFIIRVSL